MEIMENKLISPKEAANMLNVTTDCLRKWEQAKKITAVKTIGGHRRYLRADVELLLGSTHK
jgi:excisionase family DNA binding protein